jgi:hypothetical protein
MTYNLDTRLQTLRGLTPDETICELWTRQPNPFRPSPLHHAVGLKN